MKRVLRSQHDFKSVTLRNQLTSLVLYENITVTASSAKSLLAYANRFFNRVKFADLNAKKLAHESFLIKSAVAKTFEEILPRYTDGATTFVRSLPTVPRHGDNAPMTMVMLIKPLVAKEEKAATQKPETTKKVANVTKKEAK